MGLNRNMGRSKAKAALALNNETETVLGGRISKLENGDAKVPVLTKTANYQLLTTDRVLFGDATVGTFSFTLPDPASANPNGYSVPLSIGKIDSSANVVSILPFASETIGGDATFDLVVQNEILSLVSNGTNWFLQN